MGYKSLIPQLRRHSRPLSPVRPHVRTWPGAGTRAPQIIGITRHVDQRLMPTRVIEAERDQMMHAQLAHVAERHRRAGWALGGSFDDLVGAR
jgi:hypothetical protein